MVNDRASSVWSNCLTYIKRNVNEQSYKTWFAPIKPVSLVNDIMVIQVPNHFFYEWLEEHYVSILRLTIKKELGNSAKLEYRIPLRNENNDAPKPKMPEKLDPKANPINPFAIPGVKRQEIDPNLQARHRFDNFIVGDCNQLGYSAGKAIVERPGKTGFNPLILFGETGLGKTHLAQAIGNEILEKHPEKTVLYVDMGTMIDQIIKSIYRNEVADLNHFYSSVDVLIVDDIQFLEKKEKTQEIFFSIFNSIHQGGRQIILTSDCAPKDMQGVDSRLVSRFKWGLSADLSMPSFETRMAILDANCQKEDLELPLEVREYICYNVRNNVREIEGIAQRMSATSRITTSRTVMERAKEAVRLTVSTTSKEITLDYIKNLVAETLKMDVEKLSSKSRKREIVSARQIAMYLAKKFTDMSLKQIGSQFGKRDHTTVIYSARTVENLIDTDPQIKEVVEGLKQKLRLSGTK